MKTITFIRHAKSDWDNDLQDFERPLNKRGLKDAPIIGSQIKSKLPSIDLIISSPSIRTEQTAKIIAGSIGYPENNIKYYDELYHCSVSEYIEILIKQNIRHKHICIVSHNPGTTGIINILSNSDIHNVPTCGVANIELDIFNWEEVEPGIGKLKRYITPKDLL